MRVAVTGAAGMIGSNLVHGLNAAGIDDIVAVDDLRDGSKYRNLAGASLSTSALAKVWPLLGLRVFQDLAQGLQALGLAGQGGDKPSAFVVFVPGINQDRGRLHLTGLSCPPFDRAM